MCSSSCRHWVRGRSSSCATPLYGNAAAAGFALFPGMAVVGWDFTARDEPGVAWHGTSPRQSGRPERPGVVVRIT
jgi:hypothetical protein